MSTSVLGEGHTPRPNAETMRNRAIVDDLHAQVRILREEVDSLREMVAKQLDMDQSEDGGDEGPEETPEQLAASA